MKPIKNRFFCHECKKVKMLFKTEAQAENYLRFNAKEFAGKRHVPVRSYYCNTCMGWHVTSIESAEYYKGRKSDAETAVETYKAQKIAGKRLRKAREYRDAWDIYERGEYYAASERFLQAFDASKDGETKEQIPQCVEFLKWAYKSALMWYQKVSEVESAGLEESKQSQKLFSGLIEATRCVAEDFSEQLASCRKLHRTICHKAAECLNEEMELNPSEGNANLEQIEQKRREALRRRMGKLANQVRSINITINFGYESEALELIQRMSRRLLDISYTMDFKEELLPVIDELLDVKRNFDERFGSKVS